MDEFHEFTVYSRKMDDEFNVYSWRTWFKSLDFQQLQKLRNTWLRILPRTKGFEYRILTWDINQVTSEIVKRLAEVPPTHSDSSIAISSTEDQ